MLILVPHRGQYRAVSGTLRDRIRVENVTTLRTFVRERFLGQAFS